MAYALGLPELERRRSGGRCPGLKGALVVEQSSRLLINRSGVGCCVGEPAECFLVGEPGCAWRFGEMGTKRDGNSNGCGGDRVLEGELGSSDDNFPGEVS